MTESDAKLAIATREFMTSAVDLAVISACRQSGSMNCDALVSGVLVSVVKVLAEMGPEFLPQIEDYCSRIGPVIFDDVCNVMASVAEQHATRPMSTMQ